MLKMIFTPQRFLLLLLIYGFSYSPCFAEGSKQLMPDIDSRVALCTNGNSEFAGYASSIIDRLNFHIKDAANEVVYLNFSLGYGTGTSSILGEGDGANYYFRIKDPAGNIVYGPQLINSNAIPAGITGYNQIKLGPSALTPGGYSAYTFIPASGNGDYYVEFNKTNPASVTGSQCSFDYWDITVANASGVIDGRLWSYAWGFYSKNYNSGGYSGVFKGKLYSYSTDQIVQAIDFANSGIKGGSYRIGLSSKGPGVSGNYVTDRQSLFAIRAVGKEYKIFLNDPDITVYPSGTIIANNLTFNIIPFTCNPDRITFNFNLVQGGIVEILLDMNNNDVYDAGTRDRVLAQTLASGANTIVWDLKDGLGNTVNPALESPFRIVVTYGKSVSHLTLADVEYFPGGFTPVVIRPSTPGPYIQKLYYDDAAMRNSIQVTGYPNRQFPDTTLAFNNAAQPPAVQLEGCIAPCHGWNNFGTAATGDMQNNFINGYGNDNSLNTWWYAYLEQTALTINLSVCAPLPVKMILWNAHAKENRKVELNWVTEYESGHDHFEIERAFESGVFESIAILLDGIDIGSGKKSYQYTDADSLLKSKQLVFYRLNQVDKDGRNELSTIKTVKFNSVAPLLIQLSPNPFSDRLNLDFTSDVKGQAEVRILNSGGQSVITRRITVNKGRNNIKLENLNKLATGTYIVQLVLNDNIMYHQKIIKQ